MRLDSVRELKLSLPRHLERAFVVRARTAGLASAAVATAASRRRVTPSYFLGVSAKGRKNYRLAVRLQDHALEGSALLEEISKTARREVDVRYVGKIRARAWYRERNRPLLIGASVGYISPDYVMAGTLGCFVRRAGSSALYMLSNNHVLADENRYARGKQIIQQGALDGGRAGTDRVARLSSYVKLDPGATNLVDCAIAKLEPGVEARLTTIKGIGTLSGINPDLAIGAVVHKAGRTTGVRHGKVTAVEMDGVGVEYDIGVVYFDDQVEIEGSGTRSFSDAGDSGSLIVDDTRKAAALLFAGGDHGGRNGKGLTYGNPIQAVLTALKVRLAH